MMSIKNTIQIGDPRLKADNNVVDDFGNMIVKQVVQDLVDTINRDGSTTDRRKLENFCDRAKRDGK